MVKSKSLPVRIQRKRTKGWRMPDGGVSVTRPGRFGNPFTATMCSSAERACTIFRDWLTGKPISERHRLIVDHYYAGRDPITIEEVRAELSGRDLACWCKPGAHCHADILLEIANA